VVGLVRDLLTGTLVGKAGELWDMVTHLDLGTLRGAAGTAVGLALKDFAAKWNDPDVIKRWNFRGFVAGEALVQVLLTVFSGGAFAALKAVSRTGELADLIARVPAVERLVGAAGDLKGGVAEALRGALTGLKGAQEWAAPVLKVPVGTLVDLSEAAIKQLKTLPSWLQERFSQLNAAAMRWLLGCASPCKVNIKAIREWLLSLSPTEQVGSKLVTMPEDVITALALPPRVDTAQILEKLRRPGLDLMDVIRSARLTAKDFEKLKYFIPVDRGSVGRDETYDLFTSYLSALIPSKTGPDIAEFHAMTRPFVGRSGSALKGAMFENFARMYVPEFASKEPFRAKMVLRGSRRICDFFDKASGEIWDFKNTEGYVKQSDIDKYIGAVAGDGQPAVQTTDGDAITSVNFLFTTHDIAALNKANIVKNGFKVWYLVQEGATPHLVRLP